MYVINGSTTTRAREEDTECLYGRPASLHIAVTQMGYTRSTLVTYCRRRGAEGSKVVSMYEWSGSFDGFKHPRRILWACSSLLSYLE